MPSKTSDLLPPLRTLARRAWRLALHAASHVSSAYNSPAGRTATLAAILLLSACLCIASAFYDSSVLAAIPSLFWTNGVTSSEPTGHGSITSSSSSSSAQHPAVSLWLWLLSLVTTPPWLVLPLDSPAVLSLLRPANEGGPHAFKLPPEDKLVWNGMLAGDVAFDPDARYVYFTRGMDLCVGFIHFTASLRCRVELAERMGRTLVSDGRFCTADVHSADGLPYFQHLYAYYDMDVVRV